MSIMLPPHKLGERKVRKGSLELLRDFGWQQNKFHLLKDIQRVIMVWFLHFWYAMVVKHNQIQVQLLKHMTFGQLVYFNVCLFIYLNHLQQFVCDGDFLNPLPFRCVGLQIS